MPIVALNLVHSLVYTVTYYLSQSYHHMISLLSPRAHRDHFFAHRRLPMGKKVEILRVLRVSVVKKYYCQKAKGENPCSWI